jgi:hypothetical protein
MQSVPKGLIVTLLLLVNGIALRSSYIDEGMGYGVLMVSLPLLLAVIFISKNTPK